MAFKKGSKVETRGKNPRKCTIVAAVGQQRWEIEYEDGTKEVKTSRQLQNRKSLVAAARSVAAVVLTPSKNKRKSKQRKDIHSSSLSDEDSPSDEDTPPPKQSSVGKKTRNTDNQSDSSSDSSSSEEYELRTPRPSPTPFTTETEEEIAEPDINDEDLDAGEDEDVDLAAAMHQSEAAILDKDTERRNARKRKYLTEKLKLVEDAETFVKRVQPKGLEKGSLVETRKKDATTNEPERGMIVEKVWADQGSGAGGGKKKFKWKVRLNSGQEKTFTSHQLKRQDGQGIREFVWKVVDTHFPDENNFDYDQIGVVGFDFGMFEESIDCDAPDYKYPFAQLFVHLFPGDPKDVVRRMNIAVRENNAKDSRKKKTKEFSLGEVMRGFVGVILYAGKRCSV